MNEKMTKEKEKEYIFGLMVKDGVFEGKGIYYWNNGDRYDGEWKNGLYEGREFFIIIMVIDMKVNLNTIKEKEEELFIILMEIEIWVII